MADFKGHAHWLRAGLRRVRGSWSLAWSKTSERLGGRESRRSRRNKPSEPSLWWRLGIRTRSFAEEYALRLLVNLPLHKVFSRVPDLVHPQLFTDKIRWRMMYDRRPLLHMCSDRLAARDYVAALAGEEYLIPLLGVFDRSEQVPWADISPPYVVKATHGAGWNIIVRSLEEVDPERFRRLLARWLKMDYYHFRREWTYKNVPRRIVVERFIGLDGKIPDDYKIHCFAGEPRVISIFHDRGTPAVGWTRWDPSWRPLTFLSSNIRPGPLPSPPKRLAEMMWLARVLSRDFDYIRVDLYCVEDRVYFGELTPSPSAGTVRFSDEGEAWLGAFWHLPSREAVRECREP